jgi:hypothetical protein
MTRRYDSFVLRRWQLSTEQRIEVEHLQSGGRTRADSLDAAFAWIYIHCGQMAERDSVMDPAHDRAKEVIDGENTAADGGRTSKTKSARGRAHSSMTRRNAKMSLFLDMHKLDGATAEAVAQAHEKDLETQDQYGVKYLKYWFDEDKGAVFCLAEAPDKESAIRVHREAHGLVADEIFEVSETS